MGHVCVCVGVNESAHDVVSGRSDCIACALETQKRHDAELVLTTLLLRTSRSVPLFVSPDYDFISSQGWLG